MEMCYSRESIQWFEYIHIRHAENGEHRFGRWRFDGYDEVNSTVYEYHGCFWHGHPCHTSHENESWITTIQREQEIRDAGFNLVTTTSCEWKEMPESKQWYDKPLPPPPPCENQSTVTMKDILNDILYDHVYGFLKVDIHVPDWLKLRFNEFPPLFKNTEITIADIGEHMQAYCRSITRNTGVKRSLISSMHAKGIVLLTPLLKKYLEMGLVVANIEFIISYNGKPFFDAFIKEVTHDHRHADLGGVEYEMREAASKLKGNCDNGRTLMNKAKHTRVCFTKEENLSKHVNNPELNRQIFEVEKRQKKIVHNLPLQIGLAVYSYAKLQNFGSF